MHYIYLNGSHLQKLTLFKGLYRKKLPIPTVQIPLSLNISWACPGEGPQNVQGWNTCPVKSTWRSWVCSVQSKGGLRESYSCCQCLTGKVSRRQSQVLHSGGRTRDNGQIETWAVLTGYKEKPLLPQGQPSSRAGCPGRLSGHHPWRFSRPNWIKPWATWSDPIASPALSRRLDWRPPEVPSNWPSLQFNDSEISTPIIVKIQEILPCLVVILNFAVRLKENRDYK